MVHTTSKAAPPGPITHHQSTTYVRSLPAVRVETTSVRPRRPPPCVSSMTTRVPMTETLVKAVVIHDSSESAGSRVRCQADVGAPTRSR